MHDPDPDERPRAWPRLYPSRLLHRRSTTQLVTSNCGAFPTCGAWPRSHPGSRATTRSSRANEIAVTRCEKCDQA